MSGPSLDSWESDRHRSHFGFCLDACDHEECHQEEEPQGLYAYDENDAHEKDGDDQ